MKTPIKALMMLELLNENELTNENNVIDRINIAFQEGQSCPKIKQLEWVEYPYSFDKVIIADTHFNSTYRIFKKLLSKNTALEVYAEIKYEAHLLDKFLGEFGTLEETKQACQEDFNKRILECLKI